MEGRMTRARTDRAPQGLPMGGRTLGIAGDPPGRLYYSDRGPVIFR